MAKREILLESGTNEVEIIEFSLAGQSFGVNVAKVREIISYNPDSITSVPNTYYSVMGMFLLRDSTLPLIDLKAHMGINNTSSEDERKAVMVCEFNNLVNGFLVDGVNQIHRCSWKEIIPLSSFISAYGPCVTSSITIENLNILLLDLEHVLADIYPSTRLIYSEEDDPERTGAIEGRQGEREKVHIILAEDSPIVRQSVRKITSDVGYNHLTIYDNGLDAYNEIIALRHKAGEEGKSVLEYVNALVTDVEMPQMDGLTLCRKVKEDAGLRDLPVIIFSSLVNEKMILKCKSVGADAWSNKLEVADLIHILDKTCLTNRQDGKVEGA